MASHEDTRTGPCGSANLAHDLCEGAVDYVLNNVNTVQYLIRSIEEITGRSFTRDRIKCLPAVPALFQSRARSQSNASATRLEGAGMHDDDASGVSEDASRVNARKVYAGYMWNRARPDCNKGDVVLIEDHLLPLAKCHNTTGGTDDDRNVDANRSGRAERADATASSNSCGSSDRRSDATLWIAQESAVLAQTERNIRHELLHAFDDARGYIDPSNCMHQACSEIRAARLSGDCFAAEEMKRGRWNYFSGGQQCVRRRARMAVEMNPLCRGFGDRAVDTVFRSCYSDYEPFAAPIYALGSYGSDRFENGTTNSHT